MIKNLSCLIKDYYLRQKRSESIVKAMSVIDREIVTTCNFCGSNDIYIIGGNDRYGMKIRSGLCTNCGLVFLIDRFSREGYSAFYRDYYRPLLTAYMDRVVDSKSIQNEQIIYGHTLLESFKGFLKLQKGQTLIDIGGSTGAVANEFVEEYGLIGTILDPSAAELKVAQKNGYNTICSLFECWDNSNKQYDIVLCCRTIDHFFDLKSSLLKLNKLCKSSGYLIIDIIDIEVIWKIKGVMEGGIKIDHPYYLCSEIAHSIFAFAGFQILAREIISKEERVTYICRPIKKQKSFTRTDRQWIAKRIRNIQESRLAFTNSRKIPCDWRDATHRWLYYKKQDIKKYIGL